MEKVAQKVDVRSRKVENASQRVTHIKRVPELHPIFSLYFITAGYRWVVWDSKADLPHSRPVTRPEPLGIGTSTAESWAVRQSLAVAPSAIRISASYARAEWQYLARRDD